MVGAGNIHITIRSFCNEDLAACQKLYLEGSIGGKPAENDTGVDIDDIQAAYMNSPGGHFWVACNEQGEVVGMIGVQNHDQGEAEIRRLRVRQDHHRRGIGSRLVETALAFCRDNHYLKITLDTFVEREPAIRLFEKFRFRHSRTRKVNGKELMYFYLDFYTSDNAVQTKE